jgi:hypothetical protein
MTGFVDVVLKSSEILSPKLADAEFGRSVLPLRFLESDCRLTESWFV